MEKNEKKTKPYIIPVFIPFIGCPNKCIFCNQNAVTGLEKPVLPDEVFLLDYFNEFLSYTKKRSQRLEIAFFGGNFLGMDDSLIAKYLGIAKKFCDMGENRFIRFSTRPDTITREKMALLKGFPVKTIELGIQSIDGDVLRKSGRGHSPEDSLFAVKLIKEEFPEIDLGLQIMLGLPGDSRKAIFKTLKFVSHSNPVCLRIYPTLVLKNTPLEKLYEKGEYKPFDLDTAVEISSIIRRFSLKRNISIIRMGLPPEGAENHEIVSGPWHSSFGELVISRDFFKRISTSIVLKLSKTEGRELLVKIHPSFESGARGWKNTNIKNLKKKFLFSDIVFERDPLIEKEDYRIEIK